MDENEINIRSSIHAEFSSKVKLGEDEFIVVTDYSGKTIISRVYLGGKVISTSKYDFEGEAKVENMKQIDDLMKKQHRIAVNSLKEENLKKLKSPSDYIKDVKTLLGRRSYKKALAVLGEAMEHHPDNPFVLSYFGCLIAIVNKDYKRGIDACKKAIKTLRMKVPFGQDFFYPTFYLNLGRAYVAAGRKKEAIESLRRGLRLDPDDRELQTELKRLGARKKPAIPFLKRSNPINKYVGKLLHKSR
jgi:tetratricopeptide (TPR) repeat protein